MSIISVQGRPPHLTMTVRHLQQCSAEFSLLVRLLDHRWMAARDRPNLQAGHYKRSNPAAEAFQRWISASAKSQQGRVFVYGEAAAYIARHPPPFLTGYDGLHSHRIALSCRAIGLFFSTARTNGRAVTLRY